MKPETCELAVIGAGPAGLGAAIAAGEHGVKTILIDSFTQPGGQYFMQPPAAFSPQKGTGMEEKGKTYIEKLAGLPVKTMTKTLVWGIFEEEGEFPWRVAFYGSDAPHYLLAKNIILSNGAYDTPVAFPGWTLPGVMTCGAALTLLKTYRLAPGTKALVTGTGPLLLSVAAHLIEAGTAVTAICEANRLLPKGFLHLSAMLGHLNRVWEGIQYASRVFSAGTPYKTGWSILSANGQARVEQAVIAKLDHGGRPIPGKTQTLEVDLVVSGYNLTPNTGLARMVDCQLEHRPEKGGWIPVLDEDMRASKPGIYVVGDGAGIGGADNALLEGQIAGVSVARETGHLPPENAEKIRRALNHKRQNQLRFGRLYGGLFMPPRGLAALADNETVLCRCEDVTLGQVKEAVQMGAATLKEVKMATRCGMGNCQGRICERPVSAAIADALSCEPAHDEGLGHYAIRPPLHPLPAQFLSEAQSDDL